MLKQLALDDILTNLNIPRVSRVAYAAYLERSWHEVLLVVYTKHILTAGNNLIDSLYCIQLGVFQNTINLSLILKNYILNHLLLLLL